MSLAKYNRIIKQCPFCKSNFETFDGGQKTRMFCSTSCARRGQTISVETKEKISNTVIKWIKEKTSLSIRSEFSKIECQHCNVLFQPYTHVMKFCSKSCASKHWIRTDEIKKKMSQAQIFLIENGIHFGWRSADKNMSYPEKYIKQILDELGIIYEREYHIKRWFIDFADIENKLALEVDGSQHNLPNRKASDLRKDTYLLDNGWKILRIKWRNPRGLLNTNFRSDTIVDIKKFFGINNE